MKQRLTIASVVLGLVVCTSMSFAQNEGTPPSFTNAQFFLNQYVGGPELVAGSYSPPLGTLGSPFNPDTDVAKERDILVVFLTIFDPDFHDEDQEDPGDCSDMVFMREQTIWFPLPGYLSPESPPFLFDDDTFCCGDGFCPPIGDVLTLQTVIVFPELTGPGQARNRGIFDEFGAKVNWDARVLHLFELSNTQSPGEDDIIITLDIILKFEKNPLLDLPNPQAFADAGPDLVVEGGTSVKLDGSRTFDSFNVGFDPNSKSVFNKDNISYTWEWISGPERVEPIYPNASKPAIAEVTLNEIGTYVYRLTADDGVNSVPTSDSVTVQVVSTIAENRAPIARASGPSGAVSVGSIITLDGTASFDPDGDPLTYRWQQTDEIGGQIPASSVDRFFQPLSGTNSPIATWQAVKTGTYYFRLLVNDGEFVSSQRVSVVITDAQTAGYLAVRAVSDVQDDSSNNAGSSAGEATDQTPQAQQNSTNTQVNCGTGGLLGMGLVSLALIPMRRRYR